MICEKCSQEYEGGACLHCEREPGTGECSSGSPTLIKGMETPYRYPARILNDQRTAMFAPLLWIGAILIAVPWVMATNEAATVSYPGASSGPVMAAAPAPPPASSDPDQISMVVHVPAGHWVDTGIDMCGCTQLRIEASGTWRPPIGDPVDADGANAATAAGTTDQIDRSRSGRDRLIGAAPYGALVAKVGSDPTVAVGSGRELDGDQFDDSGTLRIGMNAGRSSGLHNTAGELTVFITGSGSSLHSPAYCDVPTSR